MCDEDKPRHYSGYLLQALIPIQWSFLVISSILNYTSVLNAYPTNESLQACKTACKHSLQAVVSIILGFSKEVSDDIGANLRPVRIKHMANQG